MSEGETAEGCSVALLLAGKDQGPPGLGADAQEDKKGGQDHADLKTAVLALCFSRGFLFFCPRALDPLRQAYLLLLLRTKA